MEEGEGEKRMADASSLKSGSYVLFDGTPCIIRSLQISKTGKHGHAKARIEAVGIIDGRKIVKVCPAHDPLDVPIIEKRMAQVLSVANDVANVMDSENFETFDLKVPEELKDKVVSGINIVYWIVMAERVMKEVK